MATAPRIAVPPPTVSNEPLTAPNVLVMGPPGTGRTSSVQTLLAQDIECFVIATEANSIDAILDRCAKMRTPTDKLHWCHVKPIQPNWDSLGQMVKHIVSSTYKELSNIDSGIDKSHTAQITGVIKAFQNFTCEHCGRSFGDVASWGFDRALILDSLTGMNRLCRSATVGFKPVMAQGEWGVAMNLEEQFITGLCNTLKCYFVLIAHVDREKDEITGGTKLTVAALGTKLGPKLPADFREVVLATKDGEKFYWSTTAREVDTKNSVLPLSDKLDPDFKPIVAAFKRRQQQLEATAASSTVTTLAATA